jgi:hypothetical protein
MRRRRALSDFENGIACGLAIAGMDRDIADDIVAVAQDEAVKRSKELLIRLIRDGVDREAASAIGTPFWRLENAGC